MYENDMKIIERAQNGSKEDMTKLIEDNSRLVWSIVRRFNGRGYDIEDLYQIGSIGLIKAIQRFDTSFEVRLSTYAVPYILGEIRRYMQIDGSIKISRSIKELQYKISEIQKEFSKKGKEPTIEDIAKQANATKEEVLIALESKKPINSIYETDSSDEDGISILDKISTNVDEQTEITNRIVLSDLINKLSEREKQVILLRYFRGRTQSEVAKVIGVNQVQISRIERKVLSLMKKKLTDSAITA